MAGDWLYLPSCEFIRSALFVLSGLKTELSNQPTHQVLFELTQVCASPPSRFPVSLSLLSSSYRIQASPNCLPLFKHMMPWALVLALASAGNRSPARMAMMAMTTNSSIKVNAHSRDPPCGRLRPAKITFFIDFTGFVLVDWISG